MAKSKQKKDKVTIGFPTIFRLAVFTLLVYFLIIYLSSSSNPNPTSIPNVLGDSIQLPQNLYQALPESSRQKLQNLEHNPDIVNFQNKIDQLQQQVKNFPQKQINDFKKQIIQSIYQDLMKGIDSNND